MNKTEFVNRYRTNVETFLDAMEEFVALRGEWDALGLSSSLANGDIQGGDITAADVVAAVGSATSINSLFIVGHNTNLYKLRRT